MLLVDRGTRAVISGQSPVRSNQGWFVLKLRSSGQVRAWPGVAGKGTEGKGREGKGREGFRL